MVCWRPIQHPLGLNFITFSRFWLGLLNIAVQCPCIHSNDYFMFVKTSVRTDFTGGNTECYFMLHGDTIHNSNSSGKLNLFNIYEICIQSKLFSLLPLKLSYFSWWYSHTFNSLIWNHPYLLSFSYPSVNPF